MSTSSDTLTPCEIAVEKHKKYLRSKHRPQRKASMRKAQDLNWGVEPEPENGVSITYDKDFTLTMTKDDGDTIVVVKNPVASGPFGGHGDPDARDNEHRNFRRATVDGKKHELPFLHSRDTVHIHGATYWHENRKVKDEDRDPKDLPRCRVVTVIREFEGPKEYLVCANGEGECKICEGETGLEELANDVNLEYIENQKTVRD